MFIAVKSLVLIGAGAIGSRHLQALAGLNREWRITVVDRSQDSLAVAKYRYREVSKDGAPEPDYYDSLDNLPEQIDICIVATPADGRLDLVRDVLTRSKCRYLILEKVAFQSVDDFAEAEILFARHGVKVWVNCPRRQWSVFKELKLGLQGSERIECHFSRSHFALACNAVHLIDAFQFMTGFADVEIDASGLSAAVMDEKRAGYLEFTGILKATNRRGDVFTMSGYACSDTVPPIMTVMSDKYRWIFKQLSGVVTKASPSTRWEWEEASVIIPPQSQMTDLVVRDLIADGRCELATFGESAKAHVPMLNAFLDRIESSTGIRPERCNIT